MPEPTAFPAPRPDPVSERESFFSHLALDELVATVPAARAANR